MALAGCLATGGAHAAVEVIGVQYQQDVLFPEYNCIWHDKDYPTSCSSTYLGANLHIYLKNTGAAPISFADATLAGYSLNTVIKESTTGHNDRSVFYYWDNPPADIVAAGIPVWWKGDPARIPAGGVGQAIIRLRFAPTTPTVTVGVQTSGGNVITNITANTNGMPALASVGFSQDRTKVYLHWRRDGGANPTTIKMDGDDVTAITSTVGDPAMSFAESVIDLTSPLTYMSYHVFQGVYADGKIATAALRAWSHEFIHASWGVFPVADGDLAGGKAFVDASLDRGLNAIQNQAGGGVTDYLQTGAGKAYAASRGYGMIVWNKYTWDNPLLSFLEDEVDGEEDNISKNFCGTGYKIPCGSSPMGILAMREIAEGESYRSTYPNTPTTVNMAATFKPENYYAWGQAVDVLQSDPYYQKRLKDTYWTHLERIPLYKKAIPYIYAIAKGATRAAEPNPYHIILQSTESRNGDNVWPFAPPQCKRTEAYYALAAGAKGISYWWFKTCSGDCSNGLGDQSTQAARDVWKEMGLYGNEIKTVSHLLVASHPVDWLLSPSTNVWARALAVGTNTFILLVVNDNHYNDEAGFHSTDVPNATIDATLPAWMQSSLTAFEVSAAGLSDVGIQVNGSQLQVNLGTLKVTRMIVLTADSQLRATLQQRYDSEVRPGVCNIAPELCVNNPPSIAQHPSNQNTPEGGTAYFTILASGSSPLSYRWQKNDSNLADGGHYSGAATMTLAIIGADSNDVANYRCVVTNGFGSVTSGVAALVLTTNTAPTNSCVGIVNADAEGGFALMGGGYIANGWTEFEGPYGTNVIGYDETAATNVHDGAHSQRIRVWGEGGTSGGCFQRVAANVGAGYTVSVWMKAFDALSSCYLGVDPAGGTDAGNPGVLWSSAHSETTWAQQTVNLIATADHMTVFYKVVSNDGAKRNGYFDDASPPECVNAPPSITQDPGNQTVFAGATANFTVAANGTEPLGYRWQKNNTDLNDGGHYSGVLTPTLTVAETDSADAANYRCVVTNAYGTTNSGAATLTVNVGAASCVAGKNSDFEGGFDLAGGGYIAANWTEWEQDANAIIGYDETAIVHGGSHAQRIRVSGGDTGSAGGIYQRVPVTAGQLYSVSVWAYAGDPLTTCSLGVDPAGGTNPGSGVTWTSGTSESTWVLKTWTGTATVNYLTVFYKVATSDNVKRNGYFDGSSSGLLQLSVQRNGETLTLAWPECPNAHLEWTADLTSPAWTTATNQVNGSAGQKSATLAPAGSAGYYRLVIE